MGQHGYFGTGRGAEVGPIKTTVGTVIPMIPGTLTYDSVTTLSGVILKIVH